jgi:glutamate racemase
MSTGIECLLTDHPGSAYKLALQLDQLNSDRKQIEAGMRDQAFKYLNELSIEVEALPAALCLFDSNWHQGVVGILATEGTLGSAKFRDLLRRHGEGARVIIRPCHGWVRQVESTDLSGPRALKVVAEEIQPLIDQGVDSLVLGCTHFPFLHQTIRQVVPAKTHIIDTGPAVAKELKRRLAEQGLLRRSTEGEVRCWCSGEIAQTQYQVERLWRPGCPVLPLPAK